ncbi:MAG: hypothetical protein ACI4GC_02900 [Acutalibacteraceae bacterium]
MFGKLLKHEIRHSARYNLLVYLAAAGITVIMGISLILESDAIGFLSCFALYITGIATIIITMVSIIKNFYDTLFSRQGYLTLTLPVKGSALLLSKILIAVLWIVVSYLIMALTIVLIMFYTQQKSGSSISNILSMIDSMGLMELLPSKAVMVQAVLVLSVLAIAKMITYIGYIYFTVTIANTRLLQGHPKIFGGLTFFVLFLTVSRLSSVITNVLPISFNVTADKAYFAFEQAQQIGGIGVSGTIFEGLVAVVLLVLTGYIIENKVNLK